MEVVLSVGGKGRIPHGRSGDDSMVGVRGGNLEASAGEHGNGDGFDGVRVRRSAYVRGR